jgi:superfamily II DNA or RNA helicase
VAESWKDLLGRYPDAYTLGLTATPERSDGRPLGDIFSGLVVAASYSELLAAGHLVPCRVYQPPEQLGARHIAQDPVAAYERFTPGELGFCFSPTVDVAHQHADAFTAAGYRAEVISDRTSKRDRARHLADFATGRVRVLCNVYALTEGVDVPAASVAILARGCGHVGMYLQIVGRVLRPFPGKDTATLLDLSGASLAHGMPTSDREFSLDGEGIRRADGVEPVRVCLRCGATYEGGLTCPACDYKAESKADKIRLTIVNAELREVYAGPATPPVAKRDELTRLVAVMRERGYSAGWVVREYRRLFGSAPALVGVLDDAELRAESERYREQAAERGHRPGAAKIKFKEVFGVWPR